MRDDFSQRTKDLLANRVGWKCSNPNCRKATRGAGTGKENIINIGIASHITAASKGGPRYDENITSQERASAVIIPLRRSRLSGKTETICPDRRKPLNLLLCAAKPHVCYCA